MQQIICALQVKFKTNMLFFKNLLRLPPSPSKTLLKLRKNWRYLEGYVWQCTSVSEVHLCPGLNACIV